MANCFIDGLLDEKLIKCLKNLVIFGNVLIVKYGNKNQLIILNL